MLDLILYGMVVLANLVILFVGCFEIDNENNSFGFFLVVASGILFLFVGFFWAPHLFRDGSPSIADLDVGSYKVGFVYVAGPVVSVGVEQEEKDGSVKEEHLKFYQFPKDYFLGGEIDAQAKKLTVWTTGDRKLLRYSLER